MEKFLELFNLFTPISGSNGSSARQGLRRLMLLRTITVSIGLPGLLAFQIFSDLALPLVLYTWLILTITISAGIGYWQLKSSRIISINELFCHLLIDAIILIVVLLNTGGANNPLISYLLVLLAIAATILPRAYVNVFAITCIAIYTSFLVLDLQFEQGLTTVDPGHNMQQHLVGMWAIFLVSAILIALFITQMANAIKIREVNLAQARENAIRNEQLVAIGTLAAGTAHALGTPLSTMAILLAELDALDEAQLKSQELKGDISTLRQQVLRCKHSLTELTHFYNKDSAENQNEVTIENFINDIKEYLINMHPSSLLDFENEYSKDTKIRSSLSLRHALINIIENSIKVARTSVKICFKASEEHTQQIEISVTDDGPGIPAEVMESMGEPFISTDRESMGLGIFLANAAIAQLGGEIEAFNLKLGGAKTSIRLPLPS